MEEKGESGLVLTFLSLAGELSAALAASLGLAPAWGSRRFFMHQALALDLARPTAAEFFPWLHRISGYSAPRRRE